MTEHRPRPGRMPYDTIIGMRVGGVSGALVGGGLFVLTGFAWLIVLGAVAGGLVGYFWEKRAIEREKAPRE